jgi:prolyl 4-hydroxylase
VDTKSRISESAVLPFDDVTNRIEQRALDFRGWRNSSSVEIEDMKVQRYPVGGFYTYHYDWDPHVSEGNRVATFMIYLNDDLTGGGTNFPTLSKPSDKRWCRVIDCEDLVYPGVTFKPVAGSAVFWENMHTNGSFHRGVRHAALPVKEGVKWGLNVWFWDFDWRPDIEL